jgi:hypothetical protein
MGILITVGAQQFAAGTTALTGRDLSSNWTAAMALAYMLGSTIEGVPAFIQALTT